MEEIGIKLGSNLYWDFCVISGSLHKTVFLTLMSHYSLTYSYFKHKSSHTIVTKHTFLNNY
jgi:hypothetical protein